jgi:hypothetical protein
MAGSGDRDRPSSLTTTARPGQARPHTRTRIPLFDQPLHWEVGSVSVSFGDVASRALVEMGVAARGKFWCCVLL